MIAMTSAAFTLSPCPDCKGLGFVDAGNWCAYCGESYLCIDEDQQEVCKVKARRWEPCPCLSAPSGAAGETHDMW